jgi:hypothetical protein
MGNPVFDYQPPRPPGVQRPLPTSLVAVAVLFIICGVLSVLDILFSLFAHRIEFNFGVLGLFIGPGILRLSRGWRTCGLVMLWITLIGDSIIGVFVVGASSTGHITVYGAPVANIPKVLLFAFLAGVFALCLWEYRVLTRPDVRGLFGLADGTR